ncbi:hypothetical protein MD484_g5814, partial [Candolleomyces efflorescens]
MLRLTLGRLTAVAVHTYCKESIDMMMQQAKESVQPPAKASIKCPNCRAIIFEENINSLAKLKDTKGPVLEDLEKLVKLFEEMDPETPADVVKQETDAMENAIMQCMASNNSEMAIRLARSLEDYRKRAQAYLNQMELQNKKERRLLQEQRVLEAQIARMKEEHRSVRQHELRRAKVKALVEETRALRRKETRDIKWVAAQKLREARRRTLMEDLERDKELKQLYKQTSIHSHFLYTWQETGDF